MHGRPGRPAARMRIDWKEGTDPRCTRGRMRLDLSGQRQPNGRMAISLCVGLREAVKVERGFFPLPPRTVGGRCPAMTSSDDKQAT